MMSTRAWTASLSLSRTRNTSACSVTVTARRRPNPMRPRTTCLAEQDFVHFDLRRQRLRDRAARRDRKEFLPLLFGERAEKFDFDAEAMDVTALRRAVRAVFRVLAVVRHGHVDAFERQLLALGVEVQRHHGAAAEGGGEHVVWRGAFARAAGLGWLIENPSMRTGLDLCTE